MLKDRQNKALKELSHLLNSNGIRWSLGASMMLHFYGLEVNVDDIDVVIDEKDYEKLLVLLEKYDFKYQEPNEKYLTKHFFSLVIENTDIDIMIGFTVKTNENIYKYPFHIEKSIEYLNETIPLASIEEWLLAYKAMGREKKITLIENWLNNRK